MNTHHGGPGRIRRDATPYLYPSGLPLPSCYPPPPVQCHLCSPHSIRRLSGDMPELTAEAQRHWDPPRMILSQFEKLCSPVTHLSVMFFWRPLVYVSDTREIEGLLHSRLRWFVNSPVLVCPVLSGSSLAKVQDPRWRAQVRLRSGIIPVAVPDTMRGAISWADTTHGAFWQPCVVGSCPERWPKVDESFDAKALPMWVIGTGQEHKVVCFGEDHSRPASFRTLSLSNLEPASFVLSRPRLSLPLGLTNMRG